MENTEEKKVKMPGFVDAMFKYAKAHKYEILASVVVIGGGVLAYKMNAMEQRVIHNFNRMVKIDNHNIKAWNNALDKADEEITKLYDNCDILKGDVNTLATNFGFKGNLGCNVLCKED